MIDRGEVLPGQKLPSQRDLSNSLNLSRTALREAISILETLGVVKASAGRGVFVCEPRNEERAPIFHSTGNPIRIDEVFQARLCVLPEVCALASQQISGSQLAHLGTLIRELASSVNSGDLQAVTRTVRDFFRTVSSAVGNHFLGEIDRMISAAASKLPEDVSYSGARVGEVVSELQSILEALEYRDAAESYRNAKRHVLGEDSRRGVPVMSFSR
jgi:GntR family transcriptional repressor for pyruvate dehydrogenase complex